MGILEKPTAKPGTIDVQSTMVVTTDGKVLSGFLTQQSDEEITLITPAGQPHIVPRSKIEEIRAQKTSPMPEGLLRHRDQFGNAALDELAKTQGIDPRYAEWLRRELQDESASTFPRQLLHEPFAALPAPQAVGGKVGAVAAW